MIVYQEIFCKLFVAFESFKTLPKKHILMKINDNSTKQQINYFEAMRKKFQPKLHAAQLQIQQHFKFKIVNSKSQMLLIRPSQLQLNILQVEIMKKLIANSRIAYGKESAQLTH